MKEIQFGAAMLMALLTLKLLLLPIRPADRFSLGRTRWLMAAGTGSLAVQFAVQYALQLRSAGLVASALMINFSFFIPSSAFLALSILYLLRKDHVTQLDRFISFPIWFVALMLLGYGLGTSGEEMLKDTPQLRWGETAAGVLYAGLNFYYFFRQIRELRILRNALADFYDSDTDGMLSWMEVSIILLAVIAVIIPPLLFTNGWWLFVFSAIIVGVIFYLVDSFCFYVASKGPRRVNAMEQNEKELGKQEVEAPVVNTEVDVEAMRHVEHAVEQWTARGGHLKGGLIQPVAAEEIGVKQYMLRTWLATQGLRYNDWLTLLRINEAKQILQAHPDWNNETIALHCGFGDRSAFQKKFKDKTGMTPAEFQAKYKT